MSSPYNTPILPARKPDSISSRCSSHYQAVQPLAPPAPVLTPRYRTFPLVPLVLLCWVPKTLPLLFHYILILNSYSPVLGLTGVADVVPKSLGRSCAGPQR